MVILGGVVFATGALWWAWHGSPDGHDRRRDELAVLLKAGRLEEAEAVLTAWVSEAPGDERTGLARAELLTLRGKPAEAIPLFREAVETSADPARVWMRLAGLQQSLGQTEAAIRCCRKAIASRSGGIEPRIRLGDLLRIAGRLDEASATLEPLFQADPTLSLQVRHALAAVRNGQGRFEAAVTLVEAVLADPDLPANAKKHYAVALDDLGRRDEAARVWAELLEADPFDVEGYYRLGRLARRLQQRELAGDMLRVYEELGTYRDRLDSARKLSLGGHLALASIEYARAYAATNQIASAVDSYRRAVQIDPGDVDTVVGAILWFAQRDLLYEAQETIEVVRGLSSLPEPLAEAMAGMLAERAGQREVAVSCYENVLRARPDYRPVLLGLGRVRLEDGDLTGASDLIARAHRAQSDDESTTLMGRIALAEGRPTEASERFRAALTLTKSRGRRSEANRYLGESLAAEGNLAAAGSVLEQAVAGGLALPEAWQVLAEVCQRRGQAERSAEAQKEATASKRVQKEIDRLRGLLRAQSATERSLSYLRLAELAAERNSRARQLLYLSAAIHADSSCAEAYRRLAERHHERREIFFRIHALRRLSELKLNDTDVRARLDRARASLPLSPKR